VTEFYGKYGKFLRSIAKAGCFVVDHKIREVREEGQVCVVHLGVEFGRQDLTPQPL